MQEKSISVNLYNPLTNTKENIILTLRNNTDGMLQQNILNEIKVYLSDMPELIYLIRLLLTDGYYSDIKTHKSIMLDFLESYSYLLPMSVCKKYAEKNMVRDDNRIMEFYSNMIDNLQLICFKDPMLIITKQTMLQQYLLEHIIQTPTDINIYLNNPINCSKILSYGLVLWFRNLISQLDDNCFDYSDYIPKEMESVLGNE